MVTVVRHARSVEETHALARRVADLLRPGDVLGVHGDLGAGKTAFVQGLARGLGVTGPVSSPTFTLIHEHEGGRIPLFHLDVYRLQKPDDLADIGFDDYVAAGGAVVIEWAERVAPLLPDERLDISLEEIDGQEGRRIELVGRGPRWETALAQQGAAPAC